MSYVFRKDSASLANAWNFCLCNALEATVVAANIRPQQKRYKKNARRRTIETPCFLDTIIAVFFVKMSLCKLMYIFQLVFKEIVYVQLAVIYSSSATLIFFIFVI